MIGETDPALRQQLRSLALACIYAVLLLVIVVAAWLALRRFSRHYLNYLGRSPTRPTSSDDVWSQHRLPPGAERFADDDGDDSGQTEVNGGGGRP